MRGNGGWVEFIDRIWLHTAPRGSCSVVDVAVVGGGVERLEIGEV